MILLLLSLMHITNNSCWFMRAFSLWQLSLLHWCLVPWFCYSLSYYMTWQENKIHVWRISILIITIVTKLCSFCGSGALTHSVKALDISLKIDTELALQVGRRTNRAWSGHIASGIIVTVCHQVRWSCILFLIFYDSVPCQLWLLTIYIFICFYFQVPLFKFTFQKASSGHRLWL